LKPPEYGRIEDFQEVSSTHLRQHSVKVKYLRE